MDFQFTPIIIIMLSAAFVCFIISCYVWRYRDRIADTTIICFMLLAATVWLIAASLGYSISNPGNKIIWAKIEYIGVISLPFFVFIFSVNYSGFIHKFSIKKLLICEKGLLP